jgi:hypothetical protein
LRDECLNAEVFFTLSDVQEKLESWRQGYNQARPHSALGDSAPQEFAVLAGYRSPCAAATSGAGVKTNCGSINGVTQLSLVSVEIAGEAGPKRITGVKIFTLIRSQVVGQVNFVP